VRLYARVLGVALFGVAFVALPFTTAGAAKGENNKGGSDRSEEVRQDDRVHGDRGDGVTEDNDSDGVPNNVPDDGDNRHPSGRDRSVENGNSGNQGNSPSDPDGMSNGGADKPGGTGGVDQHDQDGNNGCGNDDDFEDDNNGKCLGRQDQSEAAAPTEASALQANALTGGVVQPLSLALEAPARMSSPTRLALETPALRSRPTSVLAFAIRNTSSAPELVEDAVVESASLRNDTPNTRSSVGGASVLGSEGSGLLPLSGAAIGLLALAGFALVVGGGSLARWARARAR
jgi:hypothetical protein